jgi:penicillin-binding protein 1A
MQLRRNRTTRSHPRRSQPGDGAVVEAEPAPSADGVPPVAAAPTATGANGRPPAPSAKDGGPGGSAEPPPRRRPRLKKLRVALVLLGLSILAFVSWIFGIMTAVASDLPQLEDRAQFAAAHNSVIFDDHNNRLATVTNNAGRIIVPSPAIAPVMKEATVAIEDKRFYQHRGVDFVGIGRAVLQDVLQQGAAQGASTITEQFVKNALQAQGSRTVFEKLREAALAYQLERHWDKDKILSEYLNEIYFGEGAYGIEAAAETYFGWNHVGCGTPGHRCASKLLPWEAAMLAGLISSPTGYDPRTHPQAALARRNLVLQDMEQAGNITAQEYRQYSRQPIPTRSEVHPPEQQSKAPYFTTWLRQQLVDLYGAGEAFSGGLKVKSTLDLALQDRVQQAVDDHVAGLGPSSSVVVLDNATGGIRAMVGGLDYHSQPFNIATEGARQPGSAFKPFTLVTALEQGISPSTVYPSAPQQLPFRAEVAGKHGKPKVVNDIFRVNNYGDEYAGSRTLLDATTYSDNSVYSQVGMRVGPANVAATAERMGVTSDLTTPGTEYSVNGGPFAPYNPALILGGLTTGVNPLEMAHAYETLAEDGALTSGTMAAEEGRPVGILKVTDSGGHLVATDNGGSGLDQPRSQQVIPTTVATTAKSILETVVQSGTGIHAQTGDYEWGKTGTTTNNGDAWFVGATKDITVAIWVGYPNSNKPMSTLYNGGPVDGGTIPADIFHDVVVGWNELRAQERARHGHKGGGATTTSTTALPSTVPSGIVAPTTPATPAPAPAPRGGGGNAAPAAPAPAPQQAPAPAPGGGTGGAPPVSGGGGVGAG